MKFSGGGDGECADIVEGSLCLVDPFVLDGVSVCVGGVKGEAKRLEVLSAGVVRDVSGEFTLVGVEGSEGDGLVKVDVLSGKDVEAGALSIGVDEGLDLGGIRGNS